MAAKGDFTFEKQQVNSAMNPTVYRNLLELYFDQHDKRQIVYHQISSFNHFMNVEVPQTILRSCPVRVTGSPDLNLTGTTRAAAGTAGTAIRVSVEGAEDVPASSTKPGGPLLQAAAADPSAPPPREVEVCVEFANVQIRKPTIFENNGAVTPMYPNDARLRNMTYAAPIYTDIIATYTMKTPSSDGTEPKITVSRRTLPHVQVGRIPVMVGSNFCLLSDTPEKTPREVGECSEDIGGYFIIQGGERVIISQERMSENVPFVFRNNKVRGKEVEVIDVKSIGPDNEGAPKSMSVKIVHHAKNAISPPHIIVTCPRIKTEIPLFVMLRALGVSSDKEIIELICGPGSTGEGNPYTMIFQECMEEASDVTTQEKAHEWLAANLGSGGGSRESYSANTLQPNKPPRTTTIKEVLAEECLPHIGGADMMFEKACYLAFIAKKVLDVFTGRVPHDDRDAYPNKKVELPGNLIGNLFRYLFGTKVIKDMKTSLTKEIHNGFWKSSGKVEDIINPSNIYKILKSTIVTIGMKSSLATGNFVGGKMGTKAGISQVMNRLTYLSGISHLRRLSTPIEKTGKLLAPRKLHNTQYGFVCPAETPEGHAVGVVKNLSSTALVSLPISPAPIVAFLYDILAMKNLGDVPRAALFEGTRILINGAWIGILTDVTGTSSAAAAASLRAAKRTGRIHPHTGITYKAARREIWINTEGGRLLRPVLNAAAVRDLLANPMEAPPWLSSSAGYSWSNVLQWRSQGGHSLIEYIDPTETENFYIAMQVGDLEADHTHMEIHPCTMLGTMASNIPFPDHNQAPRNSYQSAMGKQAMGVYALNFRERMDTMSNLLWYSSVPLASPYMSRFYRAQAMPSGFNIVVAIMTYGGYNQEDSIMINRSSLDRGLFRSEFYRTYKDEEKKNQASGEEERFCRPSPATTRHMKLANYGKLGPDGLVPENTYVTQDDVLIGKVAPIRLRGADGAAMAGINHAALQAMSSVAAAQAVEAAGGKRFRDSSKLMRTNEAGYVDRIYRGRNGEGYSFVKIRVREERVPVIGDKFSSRHGQKGTCGLILAPEDMPQTSSGIIPDIIINPHCFVGETLVSLPNGLARRIDSFSEEGMEKVLSWDPVTNSVYESFSLGRSDRGIKSTIRLTLEDGRQIRCTPDHKFNVRLVDGSIVGKEAGQLTLSDSLVMSVQGTEDVVCPLETSWSLTMGKYMFETATAAGREKAMAFARILGSSMRSEYGASMFFNNHYDQHSVMSDVVAVTGELPVVSSRNSNVLSLPKDIAVAIHEELSCTSPGHPSFLFDPKCPTSVIREYLAAFRSACGVESSVHIRDNAFLHVEYEESRCEEDALDYQETEDMENRIVQLAHLLKRVGVQTNIIRTPLFAEDPNDIRLKSIRAVVISSNTEFKNKIGVRHCIKRQMQLEAAVAYEGCTLKKTFQEWLKIHECAEWFLDSQQIKDVIPTYTMGLMRLEVSHDAPVYDIGVSRTHYFIAQGCAVSNCIPSRMTIAQLMETLLGRLGCEEGFLGDATPFNTAMTAATLADELQKRGLEPYSNEVLYCGYTGKQMPTNIFMGPCFYQRLKHMVADKIHSRSTGPLVMLTRQPAEGRARDGGLRFGEMERDVMIAHGASAFLKERMMEASDNFEVHVCKGCGLIGVANKARNIWHCTGCGNTTEFSQVRIPYAYKLFLQELESMNISSRILPESRLRSLTDQGAR